MEVLIILAALVIIAFCSAMIGSVVVTTIWGLVGLVFRRHKKY